MCTVRGISAICIVWPFGVADFGVSSGVGDTGTPSACGFPLCTLWKGMVE
jgi:hypothetical protein